MKYQQEGPIYTLSDERVGGVYGYYAKGHMEARAFLELITTQHQARGAVPGDQPIPSLADDLPAVVYGSSWCLSSPRDGSVHSSALSLGPEAVPVTMLLVKPLKALTLTQPWASLMAIGAKTLETRSRSTTYRGPLAIHAGRTYQAIGGKKNYLDICAQPQMYHALASANLVPFLYDMDALLALPRGAVVAIGELIDCVRVGHDTIIRHGVCLPPAEPERSFGDYTPGRYAWVFRLYMVFDVPIPARGALGLWEWDAGGGVPT